MSFANTRIGIRMGAAFGLLLLMMFALMVIALLRFDSIDEVNDRIIEKDWVNADAGGIL